MNIIKNIFIGALAVAFSATSVFAAPNCSNPTYRAAYPEKCAKKSNTGNIYLGLIGGAALVGIGAALASNGSGDSGSSSSVSNQSTFPRLTLSSNVNINYDQGDYIQNKKIDSFFVAQPDSSDVDMGAIQHIKSTQKYQRNRKQYDSINYAWATARGFDGTNVNINVIDNFYSPHGDTVRELVSFVAPSANITTYNIGISQNALAQYDYVANTINASAPAHIYNASWQIASTDSQNAATAIYNANGPKTYIAAQNYFYNTTSTNFITQIRNTAIDNDAIFVWAAGNDSNNESGVLSALPIAFPELSGHFVNVVATDNMNKIAWFSNQCGITQNYCIAAPGSGWNTDSMDFASGTSFAAPIVSGAIATIRNAFPYMTSQQITQLLFVTATDIGEAGVDSVYGWGLLNMDRATQPVGTPKIVLSDNTIMPLNPINVSGIGANALKSANIKIAFVDDFGRAFMTNLSDNINVIPYGRGFDYLREPETDSIDLSGGIEFGFKQNNLLQSSGLTSFKSDTLTSFIGYKHEFDIYGINFYQNIRIGTTNPKADENSLISGFSNIYTTSIKMGAQWKDFAIEYAIPDTIVNGKMFMNLPIGKDNNGNIVYSNPSIDLSTKPSNAYTIKYKNISATFVENPDYKNEFFIMARGKFAF